MWTSEAGNIILNCVVHSNRKPVFNFLLTLFVKGTIANIGYLVHVRKFIDLKNIVNHVSVIEQY